MIIMNTFMNKRVLNEGYLSYDNIPVISMSYLSNKLFPKNSVRRDFAVWIKLYPFSGWVAILRSLRCNYALTKQEIAEEYYSVTGVESICDLEIYDLYDWDFDRNCKVDLPDFAEVAARWLADYRIYPD